MAGQLRDQARSCEAMGSPLYTRLLDGGAADVAAGGPLWDVLSAHVAPGRGKAVALRFMAAVHRLVLTGRAPELARHYPSAGGTPDLDRVFAVFRDAVAGQTDLIRDLTSRPCQTNEVGRAAALVFGFLEAAAIARRPLRLLEIGASAGLNLRWDRFCYGGGGASWGDPASPVDLRGLWQEPPLALDATVEVRERRGCDPNPLDPGLPEDRLSLQSAVWADQSARLARLAGAFRLAERVPAELERAPASAWLPRVLAEPVPDAAAVVYHSVVEEYLPVEEREAVRQALAEAGRRATAAAPLAWVRLEPVTAVRGHGVSLTVWPGGATRVLAICGAHGTDCRRAPGASR